MRTTRSPQRARRLVGRVLVSVFAAIGFVAAAVGHASAAPFAYIANGGYGTVTAVDVETNTAVRVISLPSAGSTDVVVTPDGTRVYVTNGSFVSVIDTATNRVRRSVTVGDSPSGMAVTPDGKFVYIADRSAGTVFVMDTTSDAVVATVLVGFQPTVVAVTPDGSKVYVAGIGKFVAAIDATTNTIVSSIPIGEDSGEIVISPDGSKVYVSHFGAARVSVIQTASNTVSATVPVGSSPIGMAVTPDGTRLYVADRDPTSRHGSIAVVDTMSNTLLERVTLSPDHDPSRLALTPDGARAYVTARFRSVEFHSVVLVIDTAVHAVVENLFTIPNPRNLVLGGSPPSGIAITPPPVAGLLPPVELYASSIVGSQVTLRWTPRPTAVKSTGYVLEGGISPGQVLASISTGSVTPSFTFNAPTGAFYVRVHALAGTVKSAASNEIPIFVNVSAPPSAPANLLGLVADTTLTLAWRNTYGGGAPTSLLLDVSPLDGTFPLPLGDRFSFSGVPPGTYALSLRAVNAAGTSTSSNAISLTFPSPCSGRPQVPVNFLASTVGNVISVSWDPPDSGPAPTGYDLVVFGRINTFIRLTTRSLSARVGSGTYRFLVSAINSCSFFEPFTAPQTIVVP